MFPTLWTFSQDIYRIAPLRLFNYSRSKNCPRKKPIMFISLNLAEAETIFDALSENWCLLMSKSWERVSMSRLPSGSAGGYHNVGDKFPSITIPHYE